MQLSWISKQVDLLPKASNSSSSSQIMTSKNFLSGPATGEGQSPKYDGEEGRAGLLVDIKMKYCILLVLLQ